MKFTAFLDVTPCGLVTVSDVLDFKVERIMGWKQRQQDPPKCWYIYTRLHGVTSPRTIISSGLNKGKLQTLTHRYCFNCALTAKNMSLLAHHNMQRLTEIWMIHMTQCFIHSFMPICATVWKLGDTAMHTHTMKWHPTAQTFTKFEWCNGCLNRPPVLGSYIYSAL